MLRFKNCKKSLWWFCAVSYVESAHLWWFWTTTDFIKTSMVRSSGLVEVALLLFGFCLPVLSQGNHGDVSIQTTTRNSGGVSPNPTPVDHPPPTMMISMELLGIVLTISSLVVALVILASILLVIFVRVRRNKITIVKRTLSIPANLQNISRHYSIGKSQDMYNSESNATPSNQAFTKSYPPPHLPILAQLSKTLIPSMQQNPDYARCIVNSEIINDDSEESSCASPDNSARHVEITNTLSRNSTLGPVYDAPPMTTSGCDEGPLEVSSSDIRVVEELGEGTFGHVHLAETINLSEKDLGLSSNSEQKPVLVAVKMLRENASADIQLAFEKECKFMSRLDHANVIRLLGVCREGQHFLLMEHMKNGDLHGFLQKYQMVSTNSASVSPTSISQKVLLYMSLQIASAMKYLASNNFVHRDLATRNCLVGRDFVIKVSDFGMSRNLYDSCYYMLQGKAMLPVRWMAGECFTGKFSQKSDVWAFGVTMWEIYTLATITPYHELNDNDLIYDVLKGPNRQLLKKPDKCPQDVFHVMRSCWRHEPAERGDFSELVYELDRLYKSQ